MGPFLMEYTKVRCTYLFMQYTLCKSNIQVFHASRNFGEKIFGGLNANCIW